jgi:hypothetical protein
MNFVRLLPVLLSAVVLAAHFLRAGRFGLTTICLLFPAILLIPHKVSARVVQIALVLGSLEWMRTLVVLASHRQAMGEAWTRMAIILGFVAAFTAASALAFRMKGLRERYELG